MQEEQKSVLELVEITEPAVAVDVLFKAVELAQSRGIYSLNDAIKIHKSLVLLVQHLQSLKETPE